MMHQGIKQCIVRAKALQGVVLAHLYITAVPCRAIVPCWTTAMLLLVQIPLIPLPLPNVTIYFTIWRIISNRSAGNGECWAELTLD